MAQHGEKRARTTGRKSCALLLAPLLIGAAPPAIEQIGTSEPARAAVPPAQVDAAPRQRGEAAAIEQAARQKVTAEPAPQLTTGPRQAEPGRQLAPRGGRDRTPAQLHDARKTAEASPALTRRQESRDTAVAVVRGQDRCDAQASPSDPACAHVIEARADEFQQPDPLTLSPEQRLLAERPRRNEAPSVELATRRLANEGVPTGLVEEGIVVMTQAPVLPPSEPASEDPAAGLPEGAAALIDAIAAGIVGRN